MVVIMDLRKSIDEFLKYEEKFKKWEASRIIIDKDKSIWELKSVDGSGEKVSLYRDKTDMFVSGTYGQLTFDRVDPSSSVHTIINIDDDEINFQNLSYLCREDVRNCFSRESLVEDIFLWLKKQIESEVEDADRLAREFTDLAMNGEFFDSPDEVKEYCELNKCEESCELLEFIQTCFDSAYNSSQDWNLFLETSSYYELDSRCDKIGENSLFCAGVRVSQNYYINMYALQVCSEKLAEEIEGDSCEREIILSELENLSLPLIMWMRDNNLTNTQISIVNGSPKLSKAIDGCSTTNLYVGEVDTLNIGDTNLITSVNIGNVKKLNVAASNNSSDRTFNIENIEEMTSISENSAEIEIDKINKDNKI